jgi:hypothetical protein
MEDLGKWVSIDISDQFKLFENGLTGAFDNHPEVQQGL